MQSAPDWLMKPSRPGRAIERAKVALKLETGLITPRQFGPTTRIPPFRASSSTCRSSASPSAPSSLKPALMMTAPLTPFCAHSRITAGTALEGVEMTASSQSPGIAETEGYAFTPSTLGRFGLTG